jgi:hypothetical protein
MGQRTSSCTGLSDRWAEHFAGWVIPAPRQAERPARWPGHATIRAMAPTDPQIRQVIAAMLERREAEATLCPSEAARALAPHDWRPLMARVRVVAADMAREGLLEIRQGGVRVPHDAPLQGPIRLGRPRRVGPV